MTVSAYPGYMQRATDELNISVMEVPAILIEVLVVSSNSSSPLPSFQIIKQNVQNSPSCFQMATYM